MCVFVCTYTEGLIEVDWDFLFLFPANDLPKCLYTVIHT